MTDKCKCPVCDTENVNQSSYLAIRDLAYDCPRCGKFIIYNCLDDLNHKQKAVLSHYIRKSQNNIAGGELYVFQNYKNKNEETPPYTFYIDEIKTYDLPKVAEQANNLINLIGDNTDGLGGNHWTVSYRELSAVLGCVINYQESGFFNLVKELKELINYQPPIYDSANCGLSLTYKGWERYEKLRVGSRGNKAFMAMQFKNNLKAEHNTQKILEYFKKAVKLAFEIDLNRLDEDEKAGHIDARLLAEIKSSRFMVADITHANNGAYWEAGFAEGLGKKVIYTCQKDIFEETDKNKRPHFDVAHYNTIGWDLENHLDASKRLVNIIRNSFSDIPYMESWEEEYKKHFGN